MERGNMKRLMVLLLFIVLAAEGAWAQGTAQITGTVTDQTGAVLPGVDVTATQTATGVVRTAVSDETGRYTLQSLPVGPYRLEAALPGFRTFAQTGIVLQVNASAVINAILQVGQVADTVEVQADAALVETRNTGIGTVMDNQRVLELPLNGRRVTELVLLAGMANLLDAGASSHLNPGSRNYPTFVISVGGGLETGLGYRLDGSYHNDPYNNLNLPVPFPDALQEFKVETSGLQAQYGPHSSGEVNAVTKSGTNEFHGSLFEFLRNGSLNARNTFALTNDGLKRNQFGGTIGGPIVQNKLFFFGGHQATILRAAPSTSTSYIPTAAMLSGDWTAFASAACQGTNRTLGTPFVGNRIDPALFSRVSKNLVSNPLWPSTTNSCGEIRYSRVLNEDEYVTVGKVDYQFTEKDSMFGRYMEARRNNPTDFDGKNVLSFTNGSQVQRVYSVAFGNTYLIGSNTVNATHVTYNKTTIEKYPPNFFDLGTLGGRNVFVPYPGWMAMSVSGTGGGFSWTAPSGPGYYNSPSTYEISNTVSVVIGPHQLGFGADWIRRSQIASSSSSLGPLPSFDGRFTGTGLSDMMLGRMSSFAQAPFLKHDTNHDAFGFYAQDTWKASSRLTLNMGVRWDPFLSPTSNVGEYVSVDADAFFQGKKSIVFDNAPPGAFYPGDPGYTNAYHNNSYNRFGPRLGMAWDVHGDGRMTVRSAFSIAFDMPHLYEYVAANATPPYANRITLPEPGNWDDPWANYPGGNPFPLTPSKGVFYPNTSYYTFFDRNLKPAYVQQWNLSLQRQFGTDWMIAANYLGSATVHVPIGQEVNYAVYVPGNCVAGQYGLTAAGACSTTGNTEARRIFTLSNPTQGPKYGTAVEVSGEGTQHYNGMNLSIQRRATNGVTVSANYTLSHCIGDDLVIIGTTATGSYPGQRKANRGNCRTDRRQTVNFSTVYMTPQFENIAARILGSDWQISGTARFSSGDWFTANTGTSTALRSGDGQTRANQILADPYAPNKSIDQFLNPLAFARPANGEWGTGPQIQGPHRFTINTAVVRKFQVREGQSLEFRAEAFNMPNLVNLDNPVTDIRNAFFGKVRSAGEPRIMQLALKYVF